MSFGTLKFDTITTSQQSLDASYLVNGVSKAWLNYNDHTPVIIDTFNVSSINDEATGKFKPTWTSNFSNNDYSATGNHAEDNGLYSNFGDGSRMSWYNSSRTTAVCFGSTEVFHGSGFTDMRTVEGHFTGDLA